MAPKCNPDLHFFNDSLMHYSGLTYTNALNIDYGCSLSHILIIFDFISFSNAFSYVSLKLLIPITSTPYFDNSYPSPSLKLSWKIFVAEYI